MPREHHKARAGKFTEVLYVQKFIFGYSILMREDITDLASKCISNCMKINVILDPYLSLENLYHEQKLVYYAKSRIQLERNKLTGNGVERVFSAGTMLNKRL